jgi:cation:H+ antiporter
MTIAVIFVVGLALLIGGAELFVRGASKLASALGVSPLVIGLTVVAFGTSAPELAISVYAGMKGSPDLAFGNVVGSNIFNTLFILGASALVAPLIVARRLVQLDVPLVIGASVVVLIMALDGSIGRIEGAVLFSGILVYSVWLVLRSRSEGNETVQELAGGESLPVAAGSGHILIDLVLIAVGLVMLVFGSRMLVSSAVTIATGLGVSELVVGLTVVAAGTSLPEVATSILASLKGERDIAVGNVVGSNLFNLLCVLGLTASTTGAIPVQSDALRFDVPVMIVSAIACMPIFFSGHRINRWEGALFLGYYLAYTVNVVLAATGHDALGTFRMVMAVFVIPLTAITLAVVTYREVQARRAGLSRLPSS